MAEKKKELNEKELLDVAGGFAAQMANTTFCTGYYTKKGCEKSELNCKWEEGECVSKYAGEGVRYGVMK